MELGFAKGRVGEDLVGIPEERTAVVESFPSMSTTVNVLIVLQ
jgi:hypothetical protein